MSKTKAVIFDVRGVLTSQLKTVAIAAYEKKLKLPQNYLNDLLRNDKLEQSFSKLQEGGLTTSQFFPKLEDEIKAASKKNKHKGVRKFSAKELFDGMSFKVDDINNEVLAYVDDLRKKGILVAVICNNWMDDRQPAKATQAKFFIRLRLHFDVVIESCRVGSKLPAKSIYEKALKELNVTPNEAVFLTAVTGNCTTAKELGITYIQVENTKQALEDLSKIVSLDVKVDGKVFPAPVTHDQVSHCYVEVQPGIVLHYVDIGVGPVVMMIHGFPELWYSWRHQISALADAGYRVIAMDTRGYGKSSSPEEINAYSQDEICKDVVGLMNRLSIPLSTIVGHDWGGFTAWHLASKYSDRIQAVCSVNSPYFCHEGLQKLKDNISIFNYQLYFQQEGVAEKDLEENIPKTFHVMYTNFKNTETAESKEHEQPPPDENKSGGGMMGMFPDSIQSTLITADDVEYFVKNYKKTGFRGPLNYYRNDELTKALDISSSGRKITCPALMVTTSDDVLLREEFTEGMEKDIPLLSRANIDGCGHWSMFEKSNELSSCIIEWLNKLKM